MSIGWLRGVDDKGLFYTGYIKWNNPSVSRMAFYVVRREGKGSYTLTNQGLDELFGLEDNKYSTLKEAKNAASEHLNSAIEVLFTTKGV